MYSLLILFSLSIFLSSCATMINDEYDSVTIISDKPVEIFHQGRKISLNSIRSKITLPRQSEDTKIEVRTDSVIKTITVPSSYSYWNLLNIMNYGIGLFFEKAPYNYSYPSKMYISAKDTTDDYWTYSPWNQKKGDIDFHISLPHFNDFYYTPDKEPDTKKNNGFFGLALGLDYYHTDQQYLAFRLGAITDIFVPFPAPIDYEGETERFYSTYASISNNHNLGNFTVGYGLVLSNNVWDLSYESIPYDSPNELQTEVNEEILSSKEINPRTRRNLGMGFTFPVYYKFSESFFLGLIYKPTLLSFSKENLFDYEHVISFDFGWKINI